MIGDVCSIIDKRHSASSGKNRKDFNSDIYCKCHDSHNVSFSFDRNALGRIGFRATKSISSEVAVSPLFVMIDCIRFDLFLESSKSNAQAPTIAAGSP
jgi:hypothetical protein